MDRRVFAKTLFTGTLAAPAIVGPRCLLAGQSQDDEHRDAHVAERTRILIRLAAQKVVLDHLVFWTGSSWMGMNLTRQFPRFDEQRASLGRVLGGLTRPTVAEHMRTATLVGALYLMSTTLVILPLRQFDLDRMTFTLFHRYFSWDLGSALRVAQYGGHSPSTIRTQAVHVGDVYFVSQLALLMLMVSPVLRAPYRQSS